VGKVAVQTAQEAALLWETGGINDPSPELERIFDELPAPPETFEAQLAALDVVDTKNQQDAPTVLALQPPVSQEVAIVLAPLSASDRSLVEGGRTISIAPVTYLNALDDLASRGGRPPQTGARTIDAAKIASYINAQQHSGVQPSSSVPPSAAPTTVPPGPTSTAAPTVPPSTTSGIGAGAPPNSRDNGSGFPIIVVVLIVLLLVVGAVAIYALLRKPSAPVPAVPEEPAPARPSIDDLLEVSRRLAAVTTVAEVERVALREAVGLVSATSAAFVRRQGDDLVIAHQTQDEVLIEEHINEGIIGRVAETGQPVLQVSATEPAVRNLPVALAAVPIVGGGRVTSVLLLMRPSSEPFTDHDRDLLMGLAPVTATALLSASRADSLAEASLVDPLTAVGNRRRLDAELADVLASADGRSTGVIMVDLDHFKAVNDNHGHPAGDALLQQVAAMIRDNVRPHDHVYRYGGEEFCVVLPETSGDEALQTAERVGESVRSTAFEVGAAEPLRLTVSMGVATSLQSSAADLIARADRALYEAKQSGRDRAVPATD
jgi:diguanylate cyclase (GGDEF)-like protein